MFDQWESLLPNLMTPQAVAIFVLVLLAVITLVGLVVKRFHLPLFPQSLRNRLPLAFVAVSGISVVLVVGVLLWQIRTTLIDQSGESFVALAESNRDRLAEQLAVKMRRLQDLSQDFYIANQIGIAQKKLDKLSPQERELVLLDEEEKWSTAAYRRRTMYITPVSVELEDALGSELSQYSQILVTDAYGGLSGVAGEEPDKFYFADEEWWKTVWNNGEGSLYVSEPYIAEDGQTVIIDLAMPIYSEEYAESAESVQLPLHGVLLAKLRLNDLTLFSSALSSADAAELDAAELALVDNVTGTWLFSSSQQEKIGHQIPALVQKKINQNDVSWGIDPDEAGESIIHSHARLRPSEDQPYLDRFDFTIIVQQKISRVLQGLYSFIRPLVLGGIVALALASIVGIMIARQISRPMSNLTDVAVDMADGQLDRAAPVVGAAELRTLAESFNRMTAQMRQILAGLEQQVVARTERLEIVATLGERLSSILNVEELLAEVVNQIQESFGYYHAHIYLFDDKRENLVVAAGTGEAGAEMKVKGHRIPLDAPASLVARAARTGQIVRVDNVRETEEWLPNPLLPDTYSEMAVPIILSAEGQVVGVLDVQEDEMAGLDEGDAALLRSLANQIAVAIRNAHLFTEVETALAEAREVQRRFVEQAWDRSQVVQRGRGRVQFSLGESTTLSEAALAQARQQALTRKGPAVVAINGSEQESGRGEPGCPTHHALVAPVTLGETTIGNLQLHEVDPNREWTENDLSLISAVVDQVAQVAENLRLLNKTQERASREQLIGQISDRLRRAPDIETLMKTAVAELSRVLDPTRTFVRFGSAAELGVTQAEKSSSDKFSELEVEDQFEGDSMMDAELEFGAVQRETPGNSEPAELEAADQSEADSTILSEAGLNFAQEEKLSDEPSEAEAPVQSEDEVTSLPEDPVEPVDNEAEQEEEITSRAVND